MALRASGELDSRPEELKASGVAIEGAQQWIELERDLRPLTILGVPATISMVSTAGAALALVAPVVAPYIWEVVRVHYYAPDDA